LFCEIHPNKPATKFMIKNKHRIWLCDACANERRAFYKVWNINDDTDCEELAALVLAGELT